MRTITRKLFSNPLIHVPSLGALIVAMSTWTILGGLIVSLKYMYHA